MAAGGGPLGLRKLEQFNHCRSGSASTGYANSGTNNAPTVANPIPDQNAEVGTAFSYAVPGQHLQ